jgi:hypothetical protein
MKWHSIVTSCIVAALGMSSSTIAFAAKNTSTNEEISDLKRRLQVLEKRVDENTDVETQNGTVNANDPDIGVIRDVVRFGTGPYFGLDATYDGSDLLVNEPSINKDLGILRQNKYLNEHIGHVSDSGPRVQFSGNVEVWAQANSQPFGLLQTNSPIGLLEEKNFMGASADLDFAAQINTWWTGYIRLDGNVEEPSIVTLDQSFIILGDLQQLPTYATLGRLYIPSGAFNTNMASSPVTRTIGRTKATALVIGESYNGFDGALFGYDGRTIKEDAPSDRLDEWGAGLQYTTRNLFYKGYFLRAGVGFNSNVSSSDGFTNTFVLGDDGFVDNFIPATDIHGAFGAGILTVSGEYIFLNRSFQPDEISYNYEGAKPSGLNVEATFAFSETSWFKKPTNIILNYGQTKQAVALGIPKYLYGGAYQVVVMKNTIVTLEYLHRRDYGKDVTYSTQQFPEIHTGTNDTDNQVRGQVDVYF